MGSRETSPFLQREKPSWVPETSESRAGFRDHPPCPKCLPAPPEPFLVPGATCGSAFCWSLSARGIFARAIRLCHFFRSKHPAHQNVFIHLMHGGPRNQMEIILAMLHPSGSPSPRRSISSHAGPLHMQASHLPLIPRSQFLIAVLLRNLPWPSRIDLMPLINVR